MFEIIRRVTAIIKTIMDSLINSTVFVLTGTKYTFSEGIYFLGRFYNWNKFISFWTRVHTPSTYVELAKYVKKCKRFRVIGGGHSFNRLIDNSSCHIVELELDTCLCMPGDDLIGFHEPDLSS